MRLGRLVVVFFALAIVGAGVWYMFLRGESNFFTFNKTDAPYVLPALTKSYSNSGYKFSLMMPADFTAQEMPMDESGVMIVALQNTSGEGVQISLSPFDEELQTLTKERIAQDVPDMKITDEQPVEIGQNHKGLAFKSDNQAFGGASREVWFVFRGTLYQISTYERLDPLLKAIFGTWQFI